MVASSKEFRNPFSVLETRAAWIDTQWRILNNIWRLGATNTGVWCKLHAQEVRKERNNARKTLRQVQKTATQTRVKCYKELLEGYKADNNPTTKSESQRRAKIVSRTIKGEATKRMFGKLRQILKPTEFSRLSQIQVPRDSSTQDSTPSKQVHRVLDQTDNDQLVWDTIINKEDIEVHLLSFNREAFRVAADSPCGSGVIHDALTFTSLSEEAEACLKVELPPSWCEDRQLLCEFLASFQIPSSVLHAGPIKIGYFKCWYC